MRRVVRALALGLLLAPGAVAHAQEGATLADRLRERVRGERVYALEASLPDAAQPRLEGGAVRHPTTDETLEVVVLREAATPDAWRLVALLSAKDHAFWTIAWRAGDSPARVVTGPHTLGQPVTRDEVEAALRAMVPAGDNPGHFDGMFAGLAEHGHGVVPHLLAVITDAGVDFVIRQLAVDALGECATAAQVAQVRALRETLGRKQTGADQALAQSLVYTLAKLGDRTLLDREIAELQKRIGDARKAPMADMDPRLGAAFAELAMRHLRAGQRDEAVAAYREAILRDAQRRGIHYYNLGCAQALMGRTDDALDSLEQSVREGYTGLEWMARDGDLRSLREHARFRALVSGRKRKEY